MLVYINSNKFAWYSATDRIIDNDRRPIINNLYSIITFILEMPVL